MSVTIVSLRKCRDTISPERPRIKLLQNKIMADGHEVALTPGMGVTAEIKIGRRRVIEYILDPAMRYREESLREH